MKWFLLFTLSCSFPIEPTCLTITFTQNNHITKFDCYGNQIEQTYVIEGHK